MYVLCISGNDTSEESLNHTASGYAFIAKLTPDYLEKS